MLRNSSEFIVFMSIIFLGTFHNVFASSDLNNQKIAESGGKLFLNTEKIYIPSEYKSGDGVELVLTGYLPNLCYERYQFRV
ncbi:MAG: hypothetical protein HQK49_16780 [Oligoflexia bacterium]|nr:hypothetical protein [Oligoflexia bacterium]